MRINTNPEGQSAPAQTGRTAGTQSAKSPGQSAAGVPETAEAGDRLEISGLTGRIAKTIEGQSASRAERVEALRSAVQAGTYQVDSRAISRALIDRALSAD